MKEQILAIVFQQLILVAIIAGITFALGLIFEKKLTVVYEKYTKEKERKLHEKRKQEYLAIKQREEADKRKVQKIRDNFNREMENTGRIVTPYYAAS